MNFSYEEKGKEKKGNRLFFDKMGEIKKIQKKGSTETRIIAKENLFSGGQKRAVGWLPKITIKQKKKESGSQ